MEKIKNKIKNMKQDKKVFKAYLEGFNDIPKVKEKYKYDDDYREIKKFIEKKSINLILFLYLYFIVFKLNI